MLQKNLKTLFMLCVISTFSLNIAYADDPQSTSNQETAKTQGKSGLKADSTIKITRLNRKALRRQRRQAQQGKKKFRTLMRRFRQQMIPPRLILKQQANLGLSEAQIKQIKDLMKAAKGRIDTHQNQQGTLIQDFESKLELWETEETETNEKQLLTAMQACLTHEKARRNERLMVGLKVRKILNDQQRQKLTELKKDFWSQKNQGAGRGKARKAKRGQKRLDRLERRMERIENRRSNQD